MRGAMAMIAAAAAGLAGCGPADGGDATANAAANATAAAKHPTYCFYKDAATKDWAASVGYGGNVIVSGKARLDDARYRGELGQSEIAGDQASVWLTMAENHGYATPDRWWNVTFSIPDSAKVTRVTVMCGTKTVAELKIKR